MSFGKQLLIARKNKHMTQKQVAEAVHIERSAYTKWENDNYEPTFAYIRELAKTLEVDYNFLFYDSHCSLDSKTFLVFIVILLLHRALICPMHPYNPH